MEAKAHIKYARISPRKVQIVCDLIRGKDVKTKKPVTRIVTWDLVHAPDPGLEDKLKQNPDLK